MKTINKVALLLGTTIAASTAWADDSMSPTNEIVPAITRQQFVSDAATAGMKEVYLSRLALDKSTSADVKNFATHMIKDHTGANMKLAKIAQDEQLDFPSTNTFTTDDPMWNTPLLANPQDIKGAQMLMLTNQPSLADYRAIQHMKTLDGIQFDQAFAAGMARDHQAVVNEFEMTQQHLADPQLDKFAKNTLPTLRKHLQMAQELDAHYNGMAGGTNLVVHTSM